MLKLILEEFDLKLRVKKLTELGVDSLLYLIYVIIHDDKYLLIVIPHIELFNVNIFELYKRPINLL